MSETLTEKNQLLYKIVDVLPVELSVNVFNQEDTDIYMHLYLEPIMT